MENNGNSKPIKIGQGVAEKDENSLDTLQFKYTQSTKHLAVDNCWFYVIELELETL